MGTGRDERVDAYIAALEPWQQAICEAVRAIAHAADPEMEETVKRKGQPPFVLQGNVCALHAAKTHVKALLEMLRAIVANNRAEGWRTLKAERG